MKKVNSGKMSSKLCENANFEGKGSWVQVPVVVPDIAQ